MVASATFRLILHGATETWRLGGHLRRVLRWRHRLQNHRCGRRTDWLLAQNDSRLTVKTRPVVSNDQKERNRKESKEPARDSGADCGEFLAFIASVVVVALQRFAVAHTLVRVR